MSGDQRAAESARADFIAQLNKLHQAIGAPSLARLRRLSEQRIKESGKGWVLAESTLHDVLAGKRARLPELDWLMSFLAACEAHATISELQIADLVDRQQWATKLGAARTAGRGNSVSEASESPRVGTDDLQAADSWSDQLVGIEDGQQPQQTDERALGRVQAWSDGAGNIPADPVVDPVSTAPPVRLSLIGELDASRHAVLGEVLACLTRITCARELHLDMSGLEFIDLGALNLFADEAARRAGYGHLVLDQMSPQLHAVMETVGWHMLPGLRLGSPAPDRRWPRGVRSRVCGLSRATSTHPVSEGAKAAGGFELTLHLR